MRDISWFNTKSKSILILSAFLVLMASCEPLGELGQTDDDFCLGATLSDGTCRGATQNLQTTTVDQTDDDNSATGFGGGSHTGTVYQSGVLTLNTTTNNAELDESWTPQWDNLVGYWKFNNTVGTISNNDSIEATIGTDGILVNVDDLQVESVAGRFFNAIEFQESTDYVSLPGLTWTPSNFSISYWINPQSCLNYNQAIGGGSGWGSFVFHTTSSCQGYLGTDVGTRMGPAELPSGTFIVGVWQNFVFTYDSGKGSLYKNGKLLAEKSGMSPSTAWGGFTISGAGKIDDFAVWSEALTADEISLIYSRQSAKFSGVMRSRIIDSKNTNSSWTNIDWLTTLPFGKELPDGEGTANSESSSSYTSLANSSLMDGIVGLWHLDEDSWADVAAEVEDKSGNSNHGRAKNGASIQDLGRFDRAGYFDGSDDNVILPEPPNASTNINNGSVFAWIKTNNAGSSHRGIVVKQGAFGMFLFSNVFTIYDWNTSQNRITTVNLADGKWHHVGFTFQSGVANGTYLYIDGQSVLTTTMTVVDQNEGLVFGDGANPSTVQDYKGYIDEVAIWNRALSTDEILQLYRRGANRIKYQVRSCTNNDCSDQDSATGDGWKGPGGNYLTYFSELYNNTSISSNCVIPQKCFASELSLDGDVQTESPSIRFNEFGADGIYMNNRRYFQYRVIMESDDENTACAGGTTCMPELKSVEIGPAHTFQQ